MPIRADALPISDRPVSMIHIVLVVPLTKWGIKFKLALDRPIDRSIDIAMAMKWYCVETDIRSDWHRRDIWIDVGVG